MNEHQKISLIIAIYLFHYSFSNKQTNHFNRDEIYNIKSTLATLNKNFSNSLSLAKFNETNVLISLTPRRHKQKRSVTRKQYEIINMLWRKTKFFVDFDEKPTPTTLSINNRSISDESLAKMSQNKLNQLTPIVASSTPSFMEFYYLDELDGYLKKKGYILHSDRKFVNSRMGNKVLEKPKTEVFRQPVFAFDRRSINELDKKPTSDHTDFDAHQNKFVVLQTKNIQNETTKVYNNFNSPKLFGTQILSENDINESQWLSLFFRDPLSKQRAQTFTKTEISSESSTINDKIKFFELYDSNTIATTNDNNLHKQTFNKNRMPLNKNKLYRNNTHEPTIESKMQVITKPLRNIGNKKRDVINEPYKNFHSQQSITKRRSQGFTNIKQTKVWSEYPYTSVYIYEPLSIYCDAAAINAYWLVAAGSCLSHQHKDKLLNVRSAYIAYCGDNWWESESIVYVRRTIVHPSYRNREKKKRHIYNIGVVQVITSLKNHCNGWAPVSLVSHKFSVNSRGFPALALGWGLDRYSGKYSYDNIAKHSLATYKGTIYPKSCPDATGYRQVQGFITLFKNIHYENEFRETNLFCFSLPYKNTTHGSLLLAEGKLVALSLKRKKDHASQDSMQYTGVWRLMPWIQNLTHNANDQYEKSYDKILK